MSWAMSLETVSPRPIEPVTPFLRLIVWNASQMRSGSGPGNWPRSPVRNGRKWELGGMKEVTAMAPIEGTRRVSTGEAEFRGLYDLYYDQIYAYFARRSGAPQAPRIWSPRCFSSPGVASATCQWAMQALLWLYGVAGNVAAHKRRSMARGARLDTRLRSVPTVGADEPEPQVLRRAEYDLALRAAARLRPADREILRLAAWEELPHDEISRLLGCSVAAVDQRLHRAKKRLAKEYSEGR